MSAVCVDGDRGVREWQVERRWRVVVCELSLEDSEQGERYRLRFRRYRN